METNQTPYRNLARFGTIIALGLAIYLFSSLQTVEARRMTADTPRSSCVDILAPQDIPLPGVIDFDDLNSGDVIGARYQAATGVTFVGTNLTQAVASTSQIAVSQPNLAINQPIAPNNSSDVPMEIKFDHLVSHVGMWIGDGDGTQMTAVLTVYDGMGVEICHVSRTPVPGALTSFIGLNDPDGNIASLTLDYGKSIQEEMIDDLYYAPIYLPPPPTLCPVALQGYPVAVQAGNPILTSWLVQDFGYSGTQTFLAYDTKSHLVNELYAFAQAPSPNTGIGTFQTGIPTSAPGILYIRPAVRYRIDPNGPFYTCQGPDEIAVTVNAAPPPPTPPNGSVSGTVTDRSGAAIETVPINLCGPGGCTSTASGKSGIYAFPNQPPGSYQIRVSLKNYTPYTSTLTVRSNLNSLVNIVMRHVPPPPDPLPTGTVTGVVRDRNTLTPLANATVALSPNNGNTSGVYRNVITDANGTFTFENLPVGDYTAIATRAQYRLWFLLYSVTEGVTATGEILMFPSVSFPPTQDPASPIDLTVAHVMPVQVTQRWANTLPLVAGKTTFVRVFLEPNGGTAADMPPVLGWITSESCLPGRLEAINSATPVPYVVWDYSNGGRSWVIQSADRSLNFELPIACTADGTRTFTVEFRAPYNYPERSLANNRFNFSITFQNRRPIVVHIVRASLRYNILCPTTLDPHPAPTLAETILSFDFMKRVYPAQVYLVDEGFQDFCMSPREDSLLAGFWYTNVWMQVQYAAFMGSSAPGVAMPVPVEMGYAIIDEHECDGTTCICGQTITPWTYNYVASGRTGIHNCRETAAHELGHARGLNHSGNWHEEDEGGGYWPWPYFHGALSVFGPDETWGFDSTYANPNYEIHAVWSPVSSSMNSTTWHEHDFMAYGWPRWLSDLSWQHLFDDLVGSGPYASPAGAAEMSQRLVSTRYLMVGGYQDDKGAIQITAMRPYTDTTGNLAAALALDATVPASYTLNLVDVYGSILASQEFVVQANGDKQPNFFTTLPYPPGVSAVEVVTGTETVASQLFTSLAPVVSVNNLDSSQVYSNVITLSWTAFDADGDTLTYDVAYSQDGGDTWETKRVGLPTTSVDLDIDYLEGSESALFRVTASDGLNTATDDIDTPVRIERHVPSVEIDSLIEHQVYSDEDVILLQGTYTDREDVPPFDDIEFVWSSDRDGEIGRGQNTTAIGLSAGRHIITLTATDRDGMTGSTSVVIWVGEQIFLPMVKK